MDYLKSHSEISDVLAEGFAHIYHDKPKFPITYLVEFLRHHSATHKAKEMLVHQIASDCVKFRQLQML